MKPFQNGTCLTCFPFGYRLYIRTYIYIYIYTLQGTNISPKTGILKMIFLFPRWDMLVPWRVYIYIYIYICVHIDIITITHLNPLVLHLSGTNSRSTQRHATEDSVPRTSWRVVFLGGSLRWNCANWHLQSLILHSSLLDRQLPATAIADFSYASFQICIHAVMTISFHRRTPLSDFSNPKTACHIFIIDIIYTPYSALAAHVQFSCRHLVKTYVEKPSSIILAISAANVDLATSDALALAREVDPQGLRTETWRKRCKQRFDEMFQRKIRWEKFKKVRRLWRHDFRMVQSNIQKSIT